MPKIVIIKDTDGCVKAEPAAIDNKDPMAFFTYTFTNTQTGEVRKFLAPCTYNSFRNCFTSNVYHERRASNCPLLFMYNNKIYWRDGIWTLKVRVAKKKKKRKKESEK